MLNHPWAYGVDPTKYPCYQPVEGCIYWPVLGSLNKFNIINFTNKYTSSEYFNAVHKLLLDGIRYNMASLLQLDKFSSINSAYPTTMCYYVIKYLYEPYTLQEYQTTYG